MAVDALLGVLLGLTVLAVVLHPPRRPPRRAAPQDRTAAGLVPAGAGPVAVRPPAESRPAPDVPEGAAAALPVGTRMLPADVWDAAVVVLVLGMTLSVPVVGGVVAALVVPLVVIAPLLALRALADEAVERIRRDG